MKAYTVIAPFVVQNVNISLSIGDVVYQYTNESKVVFALSPPPIPDPVTTFIGGTEWDELAFYSWIGTEDSLLHMTLSGSFSDPSSSGGSLGSGSLDLTSGQDFFAVVISPVLVVIPTAILVSVEKPSSMDSNIFATIRADSITTAGFTVDFQSDIPGVGYKLNYVLF